MKPADLARMALAIAGEAGAAGYGMAIADAVRLAESTIAYGEASPPGDDPGDIARMAMAYAHQQRLRGRLVTACEAVRHVCPTVRA